MWSLSLHIIPWYVIYTMTMHLLTPNLLCVISSTFFCLPAREEGWYVKQHKYTLDQILLTCYPHTHMKMVTSPSSSIHHSLYSRFESEYNQKDEATASWQQLLHFWVVSSRIVFYDTLDISSPIPCDNLYMCYNLWSLWSAYGGFCQQGENLYDCASTKKHAHHCLIHCGFIIQLWDICAKFVASERQAGVSTPFFLMLLVGTSIV